MPATRKILVVTDLDATLLTHDYSWEAAKPALDGLKEQGYPLVLNSSKTLAEMRQLAKELDLDSPIISENGGLVAIPKRGGWQAGHGFEDTDPDFLTKVTGLSREFILKTAHALRDQEGYRFSGFADWSVDQISTRTGLTHDQAALSADRQVTEPIVWEDSSTRWGAFAEKMAESGIRTLRGGRFIHLMGTSDKADGSRTVRSIYEASEPEVQWTTVALGDSPNDSAMLDCADIAVIIPHEDGPKLSSRASQVIIAPYPASRGWNVVIQELTEKFKKLT
ncbi:mannosyl-3-phosphoglycerate phosphatase [Rubritalea squalenifaciens DSM 18772]|uniref:Mannosyl-3-phosphoglycerate phosphatase n=1 Tax=Rubritalea squalenifaciens DSM 18772 TaxID=1123071 RepID=A0A1M6B8K6_9BACT|nr:HAD-IIB family hydrolase [Rubritalea squalenifaciens]SHI45050.1 mannosyl-3-phosphoglycerate phosphatase [Rubritalea squalenifaciens DSM 18772]